MGVVSAAYWSRAFFPPGKMPGSTAGRRPAATPLAEHGLFIFTQSPYSSRKVVPPLTSYTSILSDSQAVALRTWLVAHGYRFREVPYARFAAEKDKTNVVFYESRKLVVQGKGTQDFVEFVLEPEILKEARVGYETVLIRSSCSRAWGWTRVGRVTFSA